MFGDLGLSGSASLLCRVYLDCASFSLIMPSVRKSDPRYPAIPALGHFSLQGRHSIGGSVRGASAVEPQPCAADPTNLI